MMRGNNKNSSATQYKTALQLETYHFVLIPFFNFLLRYLFQQQGLHALAPPAGRPDWIWGHPGPAAQFLHSGKRQTNKTFVNVSHLRKCASTPLTYGLCL